MYTSPTYAYRAAQLAVVALLVIGIGLLIGAHRVGAMEPKHYDLRIRTERLVAAGCQEDDVLVVRDWSRERVSFECVNVEEFVAAETAAG